MSAKLILLLGLPGAGKGTLAQALQQQFVTTHVSCGEVFRMQIGRGTAFGKKAAAYIEQGQLTPDEDTSTMFLDYLVQEHQGSNLLIEGYPRTLNQVAHLEKFLSTEDIVLFEALYLRANRVELIRRITNRRVCSKCERTYNLVTKQPIRPGYCDVDSHTLVQRSDDRLELIAPRIALYEAEEIPIVRYYVERGLLVFLDATRPASVVLNDASKRIEQFCTRRD